MSNDKDNGSGFTSLAAAAIQLHELYVSFKDAGFTSKEALELVKFFASENS